MKLSQISHSGRSMIEMLGVLAIVGILSIGGIKGYGTAMFKYRLIKYEESLNLFIQTIINYKDEWIRQKKRAGNDTLFLAPIMEKMGIIPLNWYATGTMLQDDIGFRYRPFIRNNSSKMVLELFLKESDSFQNKEARQICQKLWQNVLLPNAEFIYQIGLYNSATQQTPYYGNFYCSKNKKCLKSATIEDIINFCSNCVTENGKDCILVITF